MSGQHMSVMAPHVCLVQLMSLFSNDACNSHTENLISQNKLFVLKSAIKEDYPE